MRIRYIIHILLLISLSACSLNQPPAPKPEPAPPPAAPVANSADAVQRTAHRFDGKAGIFAKKLGSGETIAIAADEVFPTASTHKLIVALAIYKYLYPEATASQKKQYDTKIKAMMVVSDNAAFYSLLDEIAAKKPDALTKVLTDLRLSKTRIHSGDAFRQYGYHSVTTPREMAVVFETIYNETYLGKEMSAILKEELAHTIFRDEIPRFMQKTKVMHKTGQLPGTLCDVGIIDDGRDQILLSIYTVSKRSDTYASNFIAGISSDIYNTLRTK